MADCNETLRELEKYLDNELSAQAHRVIKRHIDGCLDCLHAFDFQAELKAIIQAKCGHDEMPPGLMARIETCFGEDIDGDGIIGEPTG